MQCNSHVFADYTLYINPARERSEHVYLARSLNFKVEDLLQTAEQIMSTLETSSDVAPRETRSTVENKGTFQLFASMAELLRLQTRRLLTTKVPHG